MGYIPLSVPNFAGNEAKYVMDAVESAWVSTGGGYVSKFEEVTAAYCGTPGAVACQNGTAALHISLLLAGVTQKDAVLVPALTFIAAVNPVAYIGAAPIFMDCDDSLCLDPDKFAAFCMEECHMEGERLIEMATGRHVKAMVVVHVFGNMADMERIMDIAAHYHIKVIEDATEALGTRYTAGRYAGCHAGTIGYMGALSYNGNKIITTGGGGMILCNDAELLKRAKHLTTQAKADELYYIHNEVGYNYRMTNLQAALGIAQMEELPGFLEAKKRNYDLYCQGVQGIPGLHMLPFREGVDSNHWFYSLFLEDGYRWKRDALLRHLSENHIQARPIWGLICDQMPYRDAKVYKIEKARKYYWHVINLPCSTSLRNAEVTRVLSYLRH